jgi:hypothetical protein
VDLGGLRLASLARETSMRTLTGIAGRASEKVVAGRQRWKEKVEEVVGRRSVEKDGEEEDDDDDRPAHGAQPRARKRSDEEVQEQE